MWTGLGKWKKESRGGHPMRKVPMASHTVLCTMCALHSTPTRTPGHPQSFQKRDTQ